MRPPGERELSCRFTVDDLRQVRQATLAWARRAGLGQEQAADFVLAVNEVTTNAIRHGSPAAVLRLRADGPGRVRAEVTDSGQWPAQPDPPDGADGCRGLALARLLCEQVTIGTGPGGTTVTLRMSAPPAHPPPGRSRGTGNQQPG